MAAAAAPRRHERLAWQMAIDATGSFAPVIEPESRRLAVQRRRETRRLSAEHEVSAARRQCAL